MKGQSYAECGYNLDVWKARQSADGTLLAVIAIATIVPVVRFFIEPGLAAAWVLGIFLFAVCLACMRLLNSAATVVKLQESVSAAPAPQIVDAEILDVYERPGRIEFGGTRSTSAYWLAKPGWHYTGQASLPEPGQSLPEPFRITDAASVYRQRSRRN